MGILRLIIILLLDLTNKFKIDCIVSGYVLKVLFGNNLMILLKRFFVSLKTDILSAIKHAIGNR